MKKLTGSVLLMAILIAQGTKPYLFWAKEKRQLTEKRPTEYQIEAQDKSVVILTKTNQRIDQHHQKIVLQDTTTLMESNIMKLEEALLPKPPQTGSELGRLLSRLSGNLLFGEKQNEKGV